MPSGVHALGYKRKLFNIIIGFLQARWTALAGSEMRIVLTYSEYSSSLSKLVRHIVRAGICI